MYLDQWPAGPVPPRSPMPASSRATQIYRHLGLWVLQGWLAMFFTAAAFAKLSQPHDLLTYMMQWPARVDPQMVRLVGVMELSLAAGLLAPVLSWRLFGPVLLACTVMLLAEALAMGAYHLLMGHWTLAAVNAALAGFAALVLIGRRTAPSRRETVR